MIFALSGAYLPYLYTTEMSIKKADTVNEYIQQSGAWQMHLEQLRDIALAAGLEESIKWGSPSYAHQGKLVLGIGYFKNWACIWFHQGAFLQDALGVFVKANEEKTKGMRQWRFMAHDTIPRDRALEYMLEARAVSESGIKNVVSRDRPIVIPEELAQALASDLTFSAAFESLSTSCKREYAEYVGEAKRTETRMSRLEKIKPMVFKKKGLHDKYKL
jgi:uncharacterized protein YdeI (YjbR/CyaY-like superfamily)